MRYLVGLSLFIYFTVLFFGQQCLNWWHNTPRPQIAIRTPMTVFVQTFAFVFLIMSADHMREGSVTSYPAIRIAGALVVLLGLYLSFNAQNHLGKNWVGGIGLQRGHKLITTGPYRYTRNPLYTGMLVSAVGIGLVALDFWYFMAGFVFLSAFLFRVPGEEAILRQKFKKKYDAYASTTGRIIPQFRKRS